MICRSSTLDIALAAAYVSRRTHNKYSKMRRWRKYIEIMRGFYPFQRMREDGMEQNWPYGYQEGHEQ